MNIEEFRTGLDYLFEQNRISEVEPYLEGALRTAIGEEDDAAVVFILNEMIGFYRETCDYDRSVMYGEKALQILESAGEDASIHYATTMINLANALRAAGRLEESITYYSRAEAAYKFLLPPDAFDFANLYNNMSLVYQEANMFPDAIDCLNHAMETVLAYPEKRFELAVTHANLGNSLIGAYKADPSIADSHPDLFDGIRIHLEQAVEIFRERNENGAHLAAALNGLGDLCTILGDDTFAVKYYYKAMEAIEGNLGRIEYYYRVKENFDAAASRIYDKNAEIPDELLSGMTLSHMYYDEVIAPMIEQDFPELVGHYCAGLFGEGSDAYGFDDISSRDHDWGPGVIILINDRDSYDRFGQKLQASLIKKAEETGIFHGFTPDISSIRKGRRGVFFIEGYYENLVGKNLTERLMSELPLKSSTENAEESGVSAEGEWRAHETYISVSEYALSAAVNGKIWYDPEGVATGIRSKLSEYYPEDIRKRKLMQECALFSQNAQYNYLRMKRRNDNVTAEMLLYEGMKNAARIAYILSKTFVPHDKWIFYGLHKLEFNNNDSYNSSKHRKTGIANTIYYVNHKTEINKMISEIIALARISPAKDPTDAQMRPVMDSVDALSMYLQNIMKELGYIKETKRYMEDIIPQLNGKEPDDDLPKTGTASVVKKEEETAMNKEDLVKRVVRDEWEAFDKVINEGGRADCQDNWNTFNIMRSSQYLTWNEDMLIRDAEDF